LEEDPAVVSETATGVQVNNLKVSDELWDRIRPLLPVVQRRRRWPGRKPLVRNGLIQPHTPPTRRRQLPTLGASNAGMAVVSALVGAGQDVRALVRDPGRSTPVDVEAVAGDLDRPPEWRATTA
jgi:transposase